MPSCDAAARASERHPCDVHVQNGVTKLMAATSMSWSTNSFTAKRLSSPPESSATALPRGMRGYSLP